MTVIVRPIRHGRYRLSAANIALREPASDKHISVLDRTILVLDNERERGKGASNNELVTVKTAWRKTERAWHVHLALWDAWRAGHRDSL